MLRIKEMLSIAAVALTGLFAGNVLAAEKPLETVPYVDLDRYLGKWYEIASIPQNFTRGCVATSATYSLKPNGEINVLNECRLNTFDGEYKAVNGTARVVDTTTNAKLEVTFFWPFAGKYWIIDLGDQYEYAAVGHPDRSYLWILSRTPTIEEEKLKGILERAAAKDFDLQLLKMTPQP